MSNEKDYKLVYVYVVMRYLGENEAERLLENFGFNVVSRFYCSRKSQIKDGMSKVGLPFVMKVGGKKIIHKKKLNGIRLNVKTYSSALDEYRDLMKIKGSDGVMIQKKVEFKREYLVGVKRTVDFGHVIVFGAGGSGVEKKKDLAFRVCPIERSDAVEMIRETWIGRGIRKEELFQLMKVVLKMNDFVKKYEKIEELDINPLVIAKEKPLILDSRILFS